MKILVTGGTGFVGSRLIPRLVEKGHAVLALARSASSHDKLRTLGATPVIGDLEDRASLVLPVVDAVIHAAAQFRFGGPRAPFFRANVDGTTALLAAAERAGATTFVYISAAGVIMDDRGMPIRNADESMATQPNSFSPYLASKAQGEAAVLAANRPGFRTVALRPPAIWGPGDAFSRELPDAIAAGRFSFIDRGTYPFATCHVDNLIEAVERAIEQGPGGRAYFVNDQEPLAFRDLVSMIVGLRGVSTAKLRSLPYPLAMALGRVMELAWALARRTDDPPLTRSMVRMLGRAFTTSDAAARRDLGYVGRTSIAEGLLRYGAA